MSDPKQLKILVVDDSITVREILKTQLHSYGNFEIKEAKSGKQAVEVFKEFLPNLVFLDINMPEMDGVQALQEIITFEPNAYVVMLSSLGTKEKVNKTLQIGAKNFLMKPVENDYLERILKELC